MNIKACVAEFVATFGLVFIGVGSIVVNHYTGGGVGLVGIAAAHGLAIAIGVAVTGHISGAHINPAVTFAMVITKRMSVGLGLQYVVFQMVGAVLGAWVLSSVFPLMSLAAVTLGTPMLAPGLSMESGIIIEAVLTFFLVISIFGSAVDARGPKSIATFVIGLAVTMDILAGGPLTGAAMNPARAFGPALISGVWTDHAVYWIGPLVGAAAAGFLYKWLLAD